jgi:Ca-activated chloride channel family protein
MPDPQRTGRRGSSQPSILPRAINTLLIVGAVVAGTIFVVRQSSSAASCYGEVALSVEAAPRVEASVRSAVEEYKKTRPEADSHCVTIRVTTRAPHETARLLSGGWPKDTAGDQPDVWIPDSTSWLELARLAEPARSLLPEKGTTVAMSPVVVAMPRKMAEALGWPDKRLSWKDIQTTDGDVGFWKERGHTDWGPFRVAFANPQASSASADAMLSVVSVAMGIPPTELTKEMLNQNLFVKKAILDLERKSSAIPASDVVLLTELRQADAGGYLPGYVSAALMPESAVFDYNRGIAVTDGKMTLPNVPLVVSYPTDGPVVQDVPFIPLTAASKDPTRAKAIDGFLRALLGETGQAAFTAEGLRTPGGTNPRLTPDAGFSSELRSGAFASAGPETRAAALQTFGYLHRRGNSLAVFDTSGSMEQEVPGSGGKTRLNVVVDAMETAFKLLADDSNLGVWQFATKLDGDADYRELVPIGPMIGTHEGVPRRDAVITAIHAMQPGGRTGLYDTALAAFRALSEAYTPGRPNQVVLLTDGMNDDPGSISLDELIATLEREFNPERPVHLITIAYGDEVDREALQRISAATKAKSYPALDSKSIFQIIIDAVSQQ